MIDWRVQIVTGGHRQWRSINYNESFHSEAKTPSCVVLAHAVKHNWEIHQINVKSAYLNAKLDCPLYMKPLHGYLRPGQEGKVCLLLKCLYGLVQASRGWYLDTSGMMVAELGFKRSSVDHSIFIWELKLGKDLIVAVATDDMMVIRNSIATVNRFKMELSHQYHITDLGELH